jgi:peptidoglycan hydrolase CwlO-like protein
MNANGLRKKLKNGLIVQKWDLVNIIEKQEKEIKELQKQIYELKEKINEH